MYPFIMTQAQILVYTHTTLGREMRSVCDSFTTPVRLHEGPTVASSLLTTALVDTRFPTSFVSDSLVKSMVEGEGLSAARVRHSTSRSRGGSGDGPALETNKSVGLTVDFLHGQVR